MKPDLDEHLYAIFTKALQKGVNQRDLMRLTEIKIPQNGSITVKYNEQPLNFKYTLFIISFMVSLFAAGLPNYALQEPISYMKELFAEHVLDVNGTCLFGRSYLTTDLFRPVDSCAMCRSVKKVGLIISLNN